MQPINREDLIAAVRAAVEPMETAYAMFEGGSAAFGRNDQWSDLDLQIICADDAVQAVAAQVEEALTRIAEVELRFEMPQPTWHGHFQIFYRFANASPFLLLDLAIMQVSSPQKFLDPEIHGERILIFDKGDYTKIEPLDQQDFVKKMEAGLDYQRGRFEIGRLFVTKELNRENPIGALAFYYGLTLAPLVSLLRARYNPYHYNFGAHSLQHDLPTEVLERLRKLYFVSDTEDLRAKHAKATQWFDEVSSV
jgi:predicted nucleotidyltransferase